MNYLAHAYLTPDDDLLLMGNLWGDLLRPRDYPGLPQAMRRGIDLHRAIDRFTDAHPDVAAMRDLLRPAQGKYTPVVVDVLLDHVLSLQWADHHAEPLEVFCLDQYARVEGHLGLLPEPYQPRVRRMLDNRWLESCATRERMQHTLRMLSMRAAFENSMEDALFAYDRHADAMERLFGNFFAELKRAISLRSAG